MTDEKTEAFLQVVDDTDCSAILEALEEAKTVQELSEECDIPLSTAYRKVNRLQEAGLVEAKVRLQRQSKPKNVYERCFGAALVTVADDGSFDVEFVDPETQDVSPSVDRRVASPIEGD